MRILVTGANGFFGQHLCKYLREDHHVIALGKGEKRLPSDIEYAGADIADAAAIHKIIAKAYPEVIVHAAAMSKPDECEQDRCLCDNINITGTSVLTNAARALNSSLHFIYVSSDFVLGEGGPHSEDVIPAPLNYYGESKLKAEGIVAQSGLCTSIVRPVFMYGEVWEGMRSTFLHWIKTNLEAGKQVKVVNDQFRTPSYVGDICRGIKSITEKRAQGIFHLAGAERMTPYSMAVRMAEALGFNTSLIEPVTEETFPEPVRRAKNGGLLIEKAKAELNFIPTSFEVGIQKTFCR